MNRISSRFCLVCLFLGFFFSAHFSLWSQREMTLSTYIDYVKKFHPFVKQAQLRVSESEAQLLKQKGAFDPKLKIDQQQKTFDGNPYYKKEEAQLSIPSYFGISFDARIQEAQGSYLNPENNLSGEQLYSIGASVELGRGLLYSPRQTAIRQARLFSKQAKEENILEVSKILTAATHSFLEWYKAYKSYQVFDQFVNNARFRFEGVKKRMESGDLAIIDTIEARIALNQRLLNKEKARLTLRKRSLEASNYLWIEEGQAVVIGEEVSPGLDENKFRVLFKADTLLINNHPKIRALRYKQNQLKLEQRLKKSNLLPQVSFNYQWLSENESFPPTNFALDPDNNTTSLKIAFPLFLRKERANVKLASLKLEDVEWEQAQVSLTLQNKIETLFFQKERLKKQKVIADKMASDYKLLFEGEQRKFEAGESSLFLVNTRESKLIDSLLKVIALEVLQKKAEISYFYSVTFNSINAEN